MKLIDSHCHLDFDVFDHDRDEVIQRAMASGIEHIVLPGTQAHRWSKLAGLCTQHQHLHACFGLHPYFIDAHDRQDIDRLAVWLETNQHVAVGECGLDFRSGQADRKQQQFYFSAQLDIAGQMNMPVVIHSVRATEQVIATLRDYPGLTGMVHSYSGSYEQAMQLIDMGFYLSFGGAISYPNAKRVREVAARLPLSHLLIETDAPDQPDVQHAGGRNEPGFLQHTLATLTELRDEPVHDIARHSHDNALRLFNIDSEPAGTTVPASG